jgi:hypothetical protein
VQPGPAGASCIVGPRLRLTEDERGGQLCSLFQHGVHDIVKRGISRVQKTRHFLCDFFKSRPCPIGPVPYVWLSLIFFLEVIVFDLVHLPLNLTFYNFGFHDEGSNLTVQFLLAHGFRPVIDFGYLYGLLPLSIERLWFSITGMTPCSYQEAMLVVGLAMAWGFARFASNLRLSGAAIILVACALPTAVRSSYANFAHALDAALLCNAFAAHAAGHRRSALTLAVISCLVKPPLGFFYVVLLIALAIIECRKSVHPWSRFWHFLVPTGVVGGVLLFVMGLMYGWEPLLWTLFPAGGAKAYKYLNYGFFHAGMILYYFPGVHVGYYAGTIAGFYLFGTFCVFIAGVVALLRLCYRRSTESHIPEELMVACATLQAIYIFLLFSNAAAWGKYSYILVMGTVLAPQYFGRVGNYVTMLAIVLAVLSNKADLESTYNAWHSTARSRTTAGLWAFPSEIQEWSQVNDTIDSGKAVVLSWAGCAFLLDPQLQARSVLYALPFQSNDREIERYASQIKAAKFVVARSDLDFVDWSLHFPNIEQAVAEHRLVWKGRYFEVLEHQ